MVARYIFGMLGNNCRQKGSPVHILAILMRIAQWWLSLGSFKEGYTMVVGLIFGNVDIHVDVDVIEHKKTAKLMC